LQVPSEVAEIRRCLIELREEMLELERRESVRLRGMAPEHRLSSRNLLHYVAMRRRDLRGLQTRLTDVGMSSIGRSEAYALASVNRLVELANYIVGERTGARETAPCDHSLGAKILDKHTRNLLGSPRDERSVRIMVTMPPEAAQDYELVRGLLENGMDCMRINCAHDDRSAWQAMIKHLHRARSALKLDCSILMDLAGPKLRTGKVEPAPAVIKIRPTRDAYGRITKPARVWISDQREKSDRHDHADGILIVDRAWLTGVRRGIKIRFLDTRGRRRQLHVVEVARGGIWAHLSRTAYFTNGTTLVRAGPHKVSKMKTAISGIPPGEGRIRLSPGDTLILTSDPKAGKSAQNDSTGQVLSPATISCTLPEVFAMVKVGERVSLDDGQIWGLVQAIDHERLRLKIVSTPPRGAMLRADKGINFPDTALDLPALTDADAQNIDFVAQHADLVGLSFANHERDVTLLVERLRALSHHPPGIMIKIETRRGFERLPAILLSAMRHPRFGVMIARGDLAVECGYERLAEIQEEILWMCEAAHCPAVWATQVLESMARTGIPSRAEITDAAMSQRAECVMLNKGPYITDALQMLDHILRRMDPNQTKKSAKLRALRLALDFDKGRSRGNETDSVMREPSAIA